MSIPVFNQVETLMYQLSTLNESGLPDYWAGYFAGANTSLGPSASTTAVWQDTGGGFYLFLDKKPADLKVFADELSELLPRIDPQNTLRFLWITNANLPSLRWVTVRGYATHEGSGENIEWTLMRSISLEVGAYQLSIGGLNKLKYIPDADGGGVSFPGESSFNGPFGGYPFMLADLFFSGPSLGAFRSAINVPPPELPEFDGVWSSWNIGLLYGAETPPEAVSKTNIDPDNIAPASFVNDMLFMPVFNRQKEPIDFGLSFDAFNPTNPSRTALSLFPPGKTANASLLLDSHLRTTRGYTIQLTPLAGNGAIPDARFVMGYCPMEGDGPEGGLRYHFSPDGAFKLTVVPPKKANPTADPTIPNQVLLGLSGLEYASLGAGNYMIAFQGDMPAFIPFVADKKDAPDVSKALTKDATTSYLTVLSMDAAASAIVDASPVYYAQPEQAPLFSGIGQRKDGVLDFNPTPAFALKAQPNVRPPVFPVGIYTGLNGFDVVMASRMENSSLAPYRNYAIGKAHGVSFNANAPAPKRRLRAETDPLGVTPQGMVAELTPDYKDYDGLIIANMPGTRYPRVDLTAVSPSFKQVLQSNQLFFVASNADVLMKGTSVRYMLTDAEKPYLRTMGVPPEVIEAVYKAVSGVQQPFETEDAFVTCIAAAAGKSLDDFLKIAGILKAEMDGWTFQLSPRTWRTDPSSPTLLIAKFCNRRLLDLANDSSSWAWPEAAEMKGGTLADTQAVLLNMLKASEDPEASESLRIFYKTVVNDPYWNGFLFLNVPVDISEMPAELKFLTAGIDLNKFYAHHIGFSQTPFKVEGGQPKLEQTAAFGLINYNDPLDLYSDVSIPFGFKTMQLLVRFANAAVVNFSAQVELMVNQLLGSALSKKESQRGNNLIIDGSYQRVGGAPVYTFTLIGENVFLSANAALTSIEVLSVQLVNGGNPSNPDKVRTTFILSGNLRFVFIPEFDLFSFGPGEKDTDSYLRYSGLCIDMEFLMSAPTDQTFTVREANTAFDMTASKAREISLINNFPLTVSSLVASPDLAKEDEDPKGQTPEDMGYTSVSAPLDQSPMKPSWYGLVYTLDLGTFGALTGSVSFKISILAAWSEGPAQPVYLGLKLPGISSIMGSFPLQGVLKIGFRNFQFETYTSNEGKLGYLLRLRNFSLSALIWSFPPGNSNIILFGQPGNPKGSLGWYAAYDSGNQKKPLQPIKPVRRLQSGRRTPPVA